MTLTVHARPFDFKLQPGHAALVIIDMQRDFIEPGGFGAALGNDVSLLEAAIGPTQTLLEAWRCRGWPVVHTRESHAPDLSDCPPAKRSRGAPALRIGDPGPMGRMLVRGQPGCQIVPALAPLPGETVIDKPGKAATIEMLMAQGGIVGWAAPLAAVLSALPFAMPAFAARA